MSQLAWGRSIIGRFGKRSDRGRARGAASVMAAVAVTLGTVGLVGVPTAGATTPGTPGTPQAPTTVYAEDFENGTGVTQELLTSYTGAAPTSETYTANPAWLTGCNGEIVEFNTPYTDLGNCRTIDTSNTRQLAYALGSFAGAADPSTNHAVTAYTDGDPGANRVEFQTVNPIPLPQSGRFLDFSVDTAALNCAVSAPLYQFRLLNGTTSTPVGGVINACTSTTSVNVPAVGLEAARSVTAGTYTSNGSVLFTGSSFGLSMTNGNGSGSGNDAAFDNIKVLDVTPQLDKSFSPATVEAGHNSTLTFTVTNTSELAAKDGWSFTDSLPSGLVVNTPAASTTCPAGVVTAAAGSSSVQVTGNLNAGMASCTVTVNVASYTAGSYTNDASNVTETGLNPPGSTSVTFTQPAAWTCSAFGYLFQDPNVTPPGSIYQVDLATGAYTNYGSTVENVNAIGYNTLDNYMYGWSYTMNQLVRIASDGTLIPLGVPAGVSTSPGAYNVGDFDSAGHYWMMNSATGQWYEIDLAPGSATYGQVLNSGTVTIPASVTSMPSDWAFINGAFYGMAPTTGGPADLVEFNPATGNASDLGPIAGVPGADIYGAAYASPGGYLWVSNNVTGEIYRVTVATKTALAVAPGPPSGRNDGARCATAPIPTITVTKTVDGRVQAADQFTVGLQNSAGTTLTSASTSGTGTTASTPNWPVTQGATFTITDAMAAGSPDALSQYVPTITCTDTTTAGPVTPGGSAPNWTLPVSTTDAYTCNVTNTPASVDLSVTKTANPNPYTAGQPLTYTVTVNNAGPANAIGATLSDRLPAQLAGGGFTWICVPSAGSTCSPSGAGDIQDTVNVLAGGTLTYTVSGTVPVTVTGSVSNTATVTPPPGITDTNCTPNCSATVTDPPPSVDLAVTKTANPDPFVPGQPLTYTVTVTNGGPDKAIGSKVSDPLPTGLPAPGFTWICAASAGSTCTPSGSGDITDTVTVAAGGTLTYTVTGTVPPSVQTGLTNTATVTPPPGAIDPSCTPNCAATVTDPPNPTLNLAVTKTVTPSPYVPGQPMTYTVTVTNAGPSDALGASVSDPLPAALTGAGFTWTCTASTGSTCAASGAGNISDMVNVAVGGTLTYMVTGTVPSSVQTSLANTATVTPPPGTTDPDCSPSCAAMVTDPANPTVDLAATKVANPSSYVPGAPLTYTVTVTNAGPSDAIGAMVSDPLPTGLAGAGFTWTCAPSSGSTCTTQGSGDITDTVTIPAGGQVVYTVTGTVPSSVQTTLDNTVTVTKPPGATDPNCNATCGPTVHTPSNPTVGLSVMKTSTPNPYVPGQALTYTVTVANAGPSDALGAAVSDPLPAALAGAGFTWTCAPSTGSFCTASGTGNIVDTVNIPSGGSLVYTITGTVPLTTTGTLDNTATVLPPPGNTDPGCTPSCTGTNTDLPIQPKPALTLLKKAGTPVDVNKDGVVDTGDTIAYTFRVTNSGNMPITDVAVSDAKLAAVSCPESRLDPGQSETCTAPPYTITAADVAGGGVTNTATATGKDPAGDPVSSAASSVTTAASPIPAAATPAAAPAAETTHPAQIITDLGSPTGLPPRNGRGALSWGVLGGTLVLFLLSAAGTVRLARRRRA